MLDEPPAQLLVEGGDAVVVEAAGDGAVDGHVAGLGPEGLGVADHLAAHVAEGVLAARRSNLLMATTSAKSSMSIFSSWLAAPNSGVIT